MTPHLNRLFEMLQMRGNKIWFYAELAKIIPIYQKNTPSYLELCFSLDLEPSQMVLMKGHNIQPSFNGSNTFGTMKICSRRVVRATEGLL